MIGVEEMVEQTTYIIRNLNDSTDPFSLDYTIP
jgi:hypothetical protein